MGIISAFITAALFCCIICSASYKAYAQGSWETVVNNAGIATMHAVVTIYGNVVLLDRTNIGASQLDLPNGKCRDNPNDYTLTHDCTAHSAILDPVSKSIRPLYIYSDTWCSSGQISANGTLIQTGGWADGFSKIRYFTPCDSSGTCDWVESTTQLQAGRWYASNQLLPDGTQIVVGGRGQTNIEFVPSNGQGATYLDILSSGADYSGDNLYPFLHLLPDGNLFIFVNKYSILYDYTSNTVVKKFPDLSGNPRNYPSAGSSVLLPLDYSDGYTSAEVLVCGGASDGATSSSYLAASYSCGRMVVTTSSPEWVYENMPIRRAMGDMVLLPTGEVLIINGAQNGYQGWDAANNPAYAPVIYQPSQHSFSTQAASATARMYHSTANLLPDGRILIAGSNPHEYYTFNVEFPTELSIEAFSPQYLDSSSDSIRPQINSYPTWRIGYGWNFNLTVSIASSSIKNLEVNLLSAPFTTHSYSQGQRLVKLQVMGQAYMDGRYSVEVTAPPNSNVAPPGYYMLFVVHQDVPSSAIWLLVSN